MLKKEKRGVIRRWYPDAVTMIDAIDETIDETIDAVAKDLNSEPSDVMYDSPSCEYKITDDCAFQPSRQPKS